MLSLASAARIIIHPGATDMRYGIRGLSAANGVEPMGYLERALSHTLEAQDSPNDFLPWSPASRRARRWGNKNERKLRGDSKKR